MNEGIGRGRGLTKKSQISSNCGRVIGRRMPPQRREHKDTSKGHTRPLIRPGIVAVGVYQVEYNFTTLNVSNVYNFSWLIYICLLISVICLCRLDC